MKKMSNKDIKSDPTTYITDLGTLTVNTSNLVVSVHDGVTPGGKPLSSSTPSLTSTQFNALVTSSGLVPNTFYNVGGILYYAKTANTYSVMLGAPAIPLLSPALNTSSVVKGVAGDPGYFLSVFCVSATGGTPTMTIRNGSNGSGAAITGLTALAMTTGSYATLGIAVDCPNGIYLEIGGTGTGSYLVSYL